MSGLDKYVAAVLLAVLVIGGLGALAPPVQATPCIAGIGADLVLTVAGQPHRILTNECGSCFIYQGPNRVWVGNNSVYTYECLNP